MTMYRKKPIFRLKDKKLQKKLDEFSGGEFSINLHQYDDAHFASHWGKNIYFTATEDEYGEELEEPRVDSTSQFGVWFLPEEVEKVPEPACLELFSIADKNKGENKEAIYDAFLEFVRAQKHDFYPSGSWAASSLFKDEFSTDSVIVSLEIKAHPNGETPYQPCRAWITDLDGKTLKVNLTPAQFIEIREAIAMNLDFERESVRNFIDAFRNWIRPSIVTGEKVPFETIFNTVSKTRLTVFPWKCTGFHFSATHVCADFESDTEKLRLLAQHPAVGLERVGRFFVATVEPKQGHKIEAFLTPEQWLETMITVDDKSLFYKFES